MIPQASIDLITSVEGLDRPGQWSGEDSGITIGCGYDPRRRWPSSPPRRRSRHGRERDSGRGRRTGRLTLSIFWFGFEIELFLAADNHDAMASTSTARPKCFVAMPISTPAEFVSDYGGDPNHFQHVLECLFAPAVDLAGFDLIPPSSLGSEVIHSDIIRSLETADLVLGDMSTHNGNVFFELGIRTALNKPLCLVRDEKTRKAFDLDTINRVTYSSALRPWELKKDVETIREHIQASWERNDGKNALWKHFGLASTAQPAGNGMGSEEKLTEMARTLERLTQKLGERDFDLSLTEGQRVERDLEATVATYFIGELVKAHSGRVRRISSSSKNGTIAIPIAKAEGLVAELRDKFPDWNFGFESMGWSEPPKG